jgi:hypothetical protein
MHQSIPYIEVENSADHCWSGWTSINGELKRAISKIDKKKIVVAVECYHGTFEEVNFQAIKKGLLPNAGCKTSHIFREEEELNQMLVNSITAPTGEMRFTDLQIRDYIDPTKLESIAHHIECIEEGVVLILGVGAGLIWNADLLVYADMSQWEIQQRFKRKDIGNIGINNQEKPYEKKYEWAFFNDWPICNQIKRELLPRCDYFLDTNNWARPQLASGDIVRKGLEQATRRPLKLAPFFDPALWDQTKKERKENNPFEYGFNCNPEEDNLLFCFGEELFEIPLLTLIYLIPEAFLGAPMVQKFGSYMPIRFNFIDTVDESSPMLMSRPGHLPVEDGMGNKFFPENAFYFLQTSDGPAIEIGSLNPKREPAAAYNGNGAPSVTFQMRSLRLNGHDYIRIPPGVLFRPGEEVLALQITTAPDIFVHENVYGPSFTGIDRPSMWASNDQLSIDQLIKKAVVLKESGEERKEEIIDLDERNSLELLRNWFTDSILHHTSGVVNILNLVEGEEIIVECPSGSFPPFYVRHGETFIIPAQVGAYQISPCGEGKKMYATLKAKMKGI